MSLSCMSRAISSEPDSDTMSGVSMKMQYQGQMSTQPSHRMQSSGMKLMYRGGLRIDFSHSGVTS